MYQTSPEVAPAGPGAIPGGGFQRIPSSPADFGALPAQALQHFGAATEQAGGELFQAYQRQQMLYNETAANEATNNFQDAATKLLYGDPSTGDTGFYGKTGRDAMDAYPAIRDRMLQTRAQLGGNLNARSRLQFDAETRRMQAFLLEQMGRHFDQQLKAYNTLTDKASLDLLGQHAALNYNDEHAFHDALADATAVGMRQARAEGAPPGSAIEHEAVLNATSHVIQERAKALLKTDPTTAKQMLDTYRPMVREDTYAALEAHLKTAGASALVDRIMGVGGAQDTRTLEQIKRDESSGNYTAKNPESTASGGYQIINETWARWAPAVGVSLAKYPTAGSAPPDVQDKVAAYGQKTEGNVPWRESYHRGVQQFNQGRQTARETGQPQPTISSNVRSDYATMYSQILQANVDPDTRQKAIGELHSRMSFEMGLADKEDREAEKHMSDAQKAKWGETAASILRGQPPSNSDLANMLATRQIDQSQYAALSSMMAGRAEHDDPETYANLNRRARAGEDVTSDVYHAVQQRLIRPQSADSIINLSDAKQQRTVDQVASHNFATLRTAAGMDAQEHPMVDLGREAQQAQVQLWSQAQQEWNQRVFLNHEDSSAVLSDMLPRYSHPVESTHSLPRPRLAGTGEIKLEDIPNITKATQDAVNSGQMPQAQGTEEYRLLQKYYQILESERKRQEALKNAPKTRGGSREVTLSPSGATP